MRKLSYRGKVWIVAALGGWPALAAVVGCVWALVQWWLQ